MAPACPSIKSNLRQDGTFGSEVRKVTEEDCFESASEGRRRTLTVSEFSLGVITERAELWRNAGKVTRLKWGGISMLMPEGLQEQHAIQRRHAKRRFSVTVRSIPTPESQPIARCLTCVCTPNDMYPVSHKHQTN
jgi:hypothetical protein